MCDNKSKKEYMIHDNGGRPFKVIIEEKNNKIKVDVCKQVFEEVSENVPYAYAYKKILEYEPARVFVGLSPKNKMTEFSGGYGPDFDGNSLLLLMNKDTLTYIFIGKNIMSFNALSEIVTYVSPVGNSDVPYPYASDINGRYYLLIEDVIIDQILPPNTNDPYEHYYNLQLITTGHWNRRSPVIKNFKGIKTFHIGKEKYTFTYIPDAGEDYDRIKRYFEKPISITTTDGRRRVMTRKEYIKIMKEFGDLIKCHKLETNVIVPTY
jgi:hypothetical protein